MRKGITAYNTVSTKKLRCTDLRAKLSLFFAFLRANIDVFNRRRTQRGIRNVCLSFFVFTIVCAVSGVTISPVAAANATYIFNCSTLNQNQKVQTNAVGGITTTSSSGEQFIYIPATAEVDFK